MTHTPIDIAALEALEKAGTPRPWRREPGTDIIWSDATGKGVNTLGANGDFIIAIRNAAPELIKAAKREAQACEMARINREAAGISNERLNEVKAITTSLRALLAEAGEALAPFAERDGEPAAEQCRRARTVAAAIQSALRDASPTTEKPE